MKNIVESKIDTIDPLLKSAIHGIFNGQRGKLDKWNNVIEIATREGLFEQLKEFAVFSDPGQLKERCTRMWACC